jgi:outer membrane protein assembly factor BamA
MKPGEVANGKKFDKGLREVQKAYGQHGYIQAHISPIPEFDDGTPKVTFKIAVDEGAQYHMGTVEFKGFSVDDAATLGKKWDLKSGAVYDQNYANRFLRDDAGEILSRIVKVRQSQGKPLPNIGTRERPDRQTLIVNLVIELKD